MAIELITGRAGEPHVDSFDVGAFNATLFGSGAYVLSGVEAALVDANNVNVSAGEMLCEGRHIRITGSGEGLTIENGLSSYKRNDIVAAKYTRGEDGIERVELVVIKGDNSTTAPIDPPMPTAGKLIDGASEVYWPLYRIVIDGLTPQTPVFIAQRQALYQLGLGTEIPAGADLNDYVTPGIYWYESSLELISNIPGGNGIGYVGFKLIVEDAVRPPSSTGANLVTQTLQFRGDATTNDSIVIYKRNYYAGRTGQKFSPWTCISGIDSIVAEGTSGDWSYIKFANGLALCSARVTIQSLEMTNAAGSLFRSASTSISLPFAFNASPDIELTPNTNINAVVCAKVYSKSTTAINVQVYSTISQTSNVSLCVSAIGKWK